MADLETAKAKVESFSLTEQLKEKDAALTEEREAHREEIETVEKKCEEATTEINCLVEQLSNETGDNVRDLRVELSEEEQRRRAEECTQATAAKLAAVKLVANAVIRHLCRANCDSLSEESVERGRMKIEDGTSHAGRDRQTDALQSKPLGEQLSSRETNEIQGLRTELSEKQRRPSEECMQTCKQTR